MKIGWNVASTWSGEVMLPDINTENKHAFPRVLSFYFLLLDCATSLLLLQQSCNSPWGCMTAHCEPSVTLCFTSAKLQMNKSSANGFSYEHLDFKGKQNKKKIISVPLGSEFKCVVHWWPLLAMSWRCASACLGKALADHYHPEFRNKQVLKEERWMDGRMDDKLPPLFGAVTIHHFGKFISCICFQLSRLQKVKRGPELKTCKEIPMENYIR